MRCLQVHGEAISALRMRLDELEFSGTVLKPTDQCCSQSTIDKRWRSSFHPVSQLNMIHGGQSGFDKFMLIGECARALVARGPWPWPQTPEPHPVHLGGGCGSDSPMSVCGAGSRSSV